MSPKDDAARRRDNTWDLDPESVDDQPNSDVFLGNRQESENEFEGHARFMRASAAALPVVRFVRTPQTARAVSRIVGGMLVILIPLLILTPWQQTSRGEGRVTAYSALDREQGIEAPVEGRVSKWYVREGSSVQEGDRIADLVDNDPDILTRLQSERQAVMQRIEATIARVASIESRAKALEASRDAASKAATFRISMATNRVVAARRGVDAADASLTTAKLNLDRQVALLAKGLASTRAVELAQLEYTRATADHDRAMASATLARSEELAIDSDRSKIEADTAASLEDARATLASANAEVANAAGELARIEVRLARQGSQAIKAPRAGTILRILARQGGEVVKSGDSLAILIPLVEERAVELWVDGRDVPLLREGGAVRLQFEGWPALQFSGWPSAAVGTFGGRVSVIDATGDGKGNFRVIATPDPTDPWPVSAYLRQGVRTHGWFLLGRVSLGYEAWRQFNGFPPTVAPPASLEAK